jgi:effector-binding domain-containing protein
VWHHYAPQKRKIDCEALVLIERPMGGTSTPKVYPLPVCRAACIVHPSDEEDLWRRKEAASLRFELAGPMRERYISSAGDSRFDLTEIQFPIRPSTGADA